MTRQLVILGFWCNYYYGGFSYEISIALFPLVFHSRYIYFFVFWSENDPEKAKKWIICSFSVWHLRFQTYLWVSIDTERGCCWLVSSQLAWSETLGAGGATRRRGWGGRLLIWGIISNDWMSTEIVHYVRIERRPLLLLRCIIEWIGFFVRLLLLLLSFVQPSVLVQYYS